MSQTSQDSREVTERRTAKGGGDYVALGRTFSASQTVRFPEAAEREGTLQPMLSLSVFILQFPFRKKLRAAEVTPAKTFFFGSQNRPYLLFA